MKYPVFLFTVCLLALICAQSSMFGQQLNQALKHFQPGYLVLANGDTLRGQVGHKGGRSFYSSMQLASQYTAGRPQAYDPALIRGFKLDAGAWFEAMTFRFPGDVVERDIFAEQVHQAGKAKLFYYYAGNSGANSVSDKDFFILEKKGQRILLTNKQAMDQLGAFVSDCPTLSAEVKTVKLNRQSLSSLLDAYASCSATAN